MPLMFCLVEFSFLEFVVLVFRCVFRIKETHERTVGNERYDAFRFIVPELQTTDPYKNDEDGDAYQMDAGTLQGCGNFENVIYKRCDSAHKMFRY